MHPRKKKETGMTEQHETPTANRNNYDDYARIRCYKWEKDNALKNAQAAGFKDLSSFIRSRCFFDPDTGESLDRPRAFKISDEDARLLNDLHVQLVRIGTNVNQAMPRINAEIFPNADLLSLRLQEAVHEIKHTCAEIMRRVGNT